MKLPLPLLAVSIALLLVTVGVFAMTASAEDAVFAANAGEDRTLECTSPAGAVVTLDGSASTANGTNDTLTSYEWREGDTLLATGVVANVTLALGTHDITLRVMNGTNETRTDNVTVRVVDTTAPVIAASASRGTLWPPNHKLVTVDTVVTASDVCSTPTWVLESATSDEADDGRGDGHTTGDVQGADVGTADTSVQLRAERMGGGDGRVYTLTYKATDASGNVARAVVTVVAPPGE